MTDQIGNNLLSALKPADFAMVRESLRERTLSCGETLYEPGDYVSTVYFPCDSAMAGFFVELPDGKGVETAMIGREGAIGGIVSQGRLPAYARCSVQASGQFLVLKSEQLEQLKLKSLSVRHLFARYADCLMAQIFQTTACNAGHTINQRAAKWMLSTIDRSGTLEIEMSQEQLAEMLGIGRSYISRVIGFMKADGLIEVRRRKMKIIDLEGLRTLSCECNENVKQHFDRVLKGVYPDDEPSEV